MEGLPSLPGYNFEDPTRIKYHVPQRFEYINGYMIEKACEVGIGGEPSKDNQVANAWTPDSVRYDPSQTYGRAKAYEPPVFKPQFVLYDKKCLTFQAYFKQILPSSVIEPCRTRNVKIIYFLEDGTITIMEKPTPNAGYPQGKIVSRRKIPKDASGAVIHWKDLNVGIDLMIYGNVYHLCSCDNYTKEFLQAQGVVMNPDEEMPQPELELKEKFKNARLQAVSQRSGLKGRKYVEYYGMVLRFYALWDDRDSFNGRLIPHIIHYYLTDDTVEVTLVREKNIGSEGNTRTNIIIKRMKVPKNWHALPADFQGAYLERSDQEVTDYYRPHDFVVGNTVYILGRRFLITDCDQFTRDFYKDKLCIEQGPKIEVNLNGEKSKQYVVPLPEYSGFGTVEDSIESAYRLRPKIPDNNLIRYLLNSNKKLRYKAVMDFDHPEDDERQFVIEYRLSDGNFSVIEEKISNLGFPGGRFLKFSLIKKPNTCFHNPEYYTPVDMKLGGVVNFFGHKFKIVGVDLAVYRYMEANPNKFPKEMIADVRKFLIREGHLTTDVKDVADFRAREATMEIDPNLKPDYMEPTTLLHTDQKNPLDDKEKCNINEKNEVRNSEIPCLKGT